MVQPNRSIKAVIFDIGGVVLYSPFIAIAAYERRHGIPHNYLNCSIAARGEHGAWQRFERGELPLFEFYRQFGEDLSDTVNGNKWYAVYCRQKGIDCPPLPDSLNVDGRELFGSMMKNGATFDETVFKAIHRIKAVGYWKIIALTNNFAKVNANDTSPSSGPPSESIPASELAFLGWQEGPTPPRLRALFDDFCDSSTLGMRKPDPAFYRLACARNGIEPHEAIFLDDIGTNLKAAKDLGMETIHVPLGDSLSAIKKLEEKLGVDLTSPGDVPMAKF